MLQYITKAAIFSLTACSVATAQGAAPVPDDGEDWWAIFQHMNFEFVGVSDGAGNQTAGFKYEVDKDLIAPDEDADEDAWVRSLRLKLEGTLAFDSDINPQDLLESEVRFHFESPQPDVDFLADYGIEFDAHVGLDANQSFTQRQTRFGLSADLIAQNSGDPSDPSWWWLGDYPAAALRLLTGASKDFAPTYVPSLYLGIDQVSPEGMDPRAMVGDMGNFARFTAAVEYRPLVLSTEGGKNFVMDLSYKYYNELSPSATVKAAGLDAYHFFEVQFIDSSKTGFFAKYTQGQLPFDLGTQEAVQIGWSFNF